MLEQLVRSRWVWLAIALFRVWNALFVRTAFNPDEYWQSTEVAHRMVFGYGYLTWEWQDDARLRGYAHPALFALLYKALELLGLDSRWAIAYGPRVLQGGLASLNDYFTYKLALVYFDQKTAKWTLVCHLVSWFIFYVMVRPFSNSIETICTTAALANWPWAFLNTRKKDDEEVDVNALIDSRRLKALSWAALGVLFRPTNAVLWIYLGGVHLLQSGDRARLLVKRVLPIALVTLGTMVIIDRVGYGEWTFVPFNFLKFNLLEGKDRLYGVHPWNWYFTQGYPSIVGTFAPLFLTGWLTAPALKKELGNVIFWTLFIYSWSAHKEFRFVLPLLPPALVYTGYCLRNLEQGLNRERPEGCESHQLERDPLGFVTRKYEFTTDTVSSDKEPLPDYIVLFSTTLPPVQKLLTRAGYTEAASFFHSQVSGDADDPEAAAAMLVFKHHP
ncbi:hypothetical protein Poli38472_000887 [Pythium oligandrum]|uniref:Mannosyltransferase n=1 Tax=Pythium oligandrum TaxID=41045 RepID=A0A8K1CDL3_PYTOL|nr:hypothetical protein Poli38472_000887 [Pythium oligandrum]|eukprot:TMW60845.1 hypothetical protein Poli38472_000887 [Pythium oligandrum]